MNFALRIEIFKGVAMDNNDIKKIDFKQCIKRSVGEFKNKGQI